MANGGREVFVGIDVGRDRLDTRTRTSGRSVNILWSTTTRRGWPRWRRGSRLTPSS